MFGGGSPTAVPWKDGRPVMPKGGGEVPPPFDPSSLVVDRAVPVPTGTLPPPTGRPYPTGPQPPRQRAPRQRSRPSGAKRASAVGRLVGLVAVVAVIAIGEISSHVHTHHSSGSSTDSAPAQDLAVGGTATVSDADGGRAAVTLVSTAVKTRGGGSAPAPANGEYLVATFTVVATTDYELDPSDFSVYDEAGDDGEFGDGIVSTTDDNGPRSALVARPLAEQTVAAGQEVTGQMVFDVSDQAATVSLYTGADDVYWHLS